MVFADNANDASVSEQGKHASIAYPTMRSLDALTMGRMHELPGLLWAINAVISSPLQSSSSAPAAKHKSNFSLEPQAHPTHLHSCAVRHRFLPE